MNNEWTIERSGSSAWIRLNGAHFLGIALKGNAHQRRKAYRRIAKDYKDYHDAVDHGCKVTK